MVSPHLPPEVAAVPLSPRPRSRPPGTPVPFFGLRAVLIALVLTPVCAYWAAEQIVDVIVSLMVPPIACLLILIVVNAGARWASPRLALTTTELVIIYGMLQVATAIAAEWMWVINPLLATFSVFKERNTRFEKLLLPNLPDWLFLKDPSLIPDYQTGGRGFLEFLGQLPVWLGPVFWWTVLVFLVCAAMLCINALMRQEWTDREKLSFPLIQLPLAMAQGGPSFWRNRFVIGGFCAAAAVDLLDGIHFLYPSVPGVNVRFVGDVQLAFPDPPFNAIGWTPIGLFPFVVGICVFLPTDLMLSVIFFFVLRKGMQIVAAAHGYPQGVFGGGGLVPSPPYFSEQSWGAFLGLFASALWVARPYLREVWHDVATGQSCPDGGVSRRWCFVGLLASLAGFGCFGVAARFPFLFVVGYLAIFLAFSTALTRMRAQLGPPTHEMAFMGPNQLLVDFHGTQGVSPGLIARTVTIFHFTNRIHRTHPMPSQLELMKMGERTGTNAKIIFCAILVATVAGSLAGHLTGLYRSYRWGARMAGTDIANVVNELVTNPRQPNVVAISMVGVGAVVVFLLNFVRFRLPWFPLNPMGYALSMNFGVDYYWFGMMVAWALKSRVQKYAGLKGYEKLHSTALGIIMGEFAVETIWAAVAVVGRYATYTCSINGRLGWNQ
jgi:hypothetical protein